MNSNTTATFTSTIERHRVGSRGLDLIEQRRAAYDPSDLCTHERCESSGNINQVSATGGRQRRRNVDAEIVEERYDVAGPTDGNSDRAHGIFKNQVPADDPREKLAKRSVAVGVGAAGHRHKRREFAVAQRGEHRRDTRQYK